MTLLVPAQQALRPGPRHRGPLCVPLTRPALRLVLCAGKQRQRTAAEPLGCTLWAQEDLAAASHISTGHAVQRTVTVCIYLQALRCTVHLESPAPPPCDEEG